MGQRSWTDDEIELMRGAYERFRSWKTAAEEVSRRLGRRVEDGTLRHALRRAAERGGWELPSPGPTPRDWAPHDRDTAPSLPPPPDGAEEDPGDWEEHRPDDAEAVRDAAGKDAVGFEELCDRLGWNPARLRAALGKARDRGYAVHAENERVGRPPRREGDGVTVVPVSMSGIFGQVSDVHVGSQHFLRHYFEDFVHTAYDAGVRVMLVTGDIADGCYPFAQYEWTHAGAEAQYSYAAEVFPRLPGLRYVGITGNHDETFETRSGILVQHAMTDAFRRAGRDDLEIVGQRGGYVQLVGPGERRGVYVHLWHPRGSPAYAISYRLQKRIEGYQPGQKPDFLFCGHLHQAGYFEERAVHAFMGGTFHGAKSAFGRSLPTAPKIGGWIVRYSLTELGAVRDVETRWRGYQETEEVRRVEMG